MVTSGGIRCSSSRSPLSREKEPGRVVKKDNYFSGLLPLTLFFFESLVCLPVEEKKRKEKKNADIESGMTNRLTDTLSSPSGPSFLSLSTERNQRRRRRVLSLFSFGHPWLYAAAVISFYQTVGPFKEGGFFFIFIFLNVFLVFSFCGEREREKETMGVYRYLLVEKVRQVVLPARSFIIIIIARQPTQSRSDGVRRPVSSTVHTDKPERSCHMYIRITSVSPPSQVIINQVMRRTTADFFGFSICASHKTRNHGFLTKKKKKKESKCCAAISVAYLIRDPFTLSHRPSEKVPLNYNRTATTKQPTRLSGLPLLFRSHTTGVTTPFERREKSLFFFLFLSRENWEDERGWSVWS